MIDTSAIRDRFVALSPHLDERGRRSFAAAEARSAGYGGIAAVARACQWRLHSPQIGRLNIPHFIVAACS
jgi:hypothetical protein